MDASIESDASQNTNSLISSGYFIENYSEDAYDSEKENNSTNNINAILESSEDKVKTLAQRTNRWLSRDVTAAILAMSLRVCPVHSVFVTRFNSNFVSPLVLF